MSGSKSHSCLQDTIKTEFNDSEQSGMNQELKKEMYNEENIDYGIKYEVYVNSDIKQEFKEDTKIQRYKVRSP